MLRRIARYAARCVALAIVAFGVMLTLGVMPSLAGAISTRISGGILLAAIGWLTLAALKYREMILLALLGNALLLAGGVAGVRDHSSPGSPEIRRLIGLFMLFGGGIDI